MTNLPEEITLGISNFKKAFVDSTNTIISQRTQLTNMIEKYKESSKNFTIHKSQIQNLQESLDKILQDIEDLKYNASDILILQDQIEEQQKIVDQMHHLIEETALQIEKAEESKKAKTQEIAKAKSSQTLTNEKLTQQWDKHSNLTRQLRDKETHVQQLRNSNEETQKAISTMEANAEEWRRKVNSQESQIDDEIAVLQKEITRVESQINDVSSEKNEAIASYQQQIAALNGEMDTDSEKIKEQVKEIGSYKAQIEKIVEETQMLKENSQRDMEELSIRKKELAELMGDLAQRMSLPETQTKEIASLELENRELKKRVQELKDLWTQATDEVEALADKISRAKIAKYDPAAQEAAIKERILRDSSIRVQEIIDNATKLLSCSYCGKLLEVPVTLVPCGHSVCHSHRFHQMDGPMCPKCGERSARAYVDHSLSVVLSKFIYIKDVLEMIKQ